MLTQPKGLLLDYGGTLVEEVDFDPRAGNKLLLAQAQAAYRPEHVSLEQVLERASKIATEVAAIREKPNRFVLRTRYEFSDNSKSGAQRF